MKLAEALADLAHRLALRVGAHQPTSTAVGTTPCSQASPDATEVTLVSCKFPAWDGQGVIPGGTFDSIDSYNAIDVDVTDYEGIGTRKNGWSISATAQRTLFSSVAF